MGKCWRLYTLQTILLIYELSEVSAAGGELHGDQWEEVGTETSL